MATQSEIALKYWMIRQITRRLAPNATAPQIKRAMRDVGIGTNDFALRPSMMRSIGQSLRQQQAISPEGLAQIGDSATMMRMSKALRQSYDDVRRAGLQIVTDIDLRTNTRGEESVSDYVQATGTSFLLLDQRLKATSLSSKFAPQLIGDRATLTPQALDTAYKRREILATPFISPVTTLATAQQRSVADILASRNRRLQQMQARFKQSRQSTPASKPAPAAAPAADDENSSKGFAQIQAAFAPYVSDADMRKLAVTIDKDHHFNDESIERAKGLLQHLYDTGVDFSVTFDDSGNRNQIRARINDSENTEVRVLDDNPLYVGRVYVGEGSYYYVSRRDKKDWLPEDPYAVLDYVTGVKNGGQLAMYKNNNAQLRLPGVSLPVHYERNRQVRKILQALSPEEANQYLGHAIAQAQVSYIDNLVGPSLEGLDTELSDDQKALADWIKSNDLFAGLSEDEIADKVTAAAKYQSAVYNETLSPDVPAPDKASLPEDVQQLADTIGGLADNRLGTLADGFNPNKVIALVNQTSRQDVTNGVVNALKYADYDLDKLIGNEYGLMMIKDRLVSFDKTKATTLDQATGFNHDVLQHVQDQLIGMGLTGDKAAGEDKPTVAIDDKGIVQWSAMRPVGTRSSNRTFAPVSGEIGQIFAPDEHGIIHTKFGSGEDYEMVPGIKGYFKYGDGKSPRMDRLRGVGYQQSMYSKIDSALRLQAIRPATGDLSAPTDPVILNKLYHGDVYGMRLENNWYEKATLPDNVKDSILKTLQGRVRFSNKLGEFATTFAESERGNDEAQNTVSGLVDHQNMRILANDYLGTFDMTMTGTNKSQGLVTYMAEGSKMTPDGRFVAVTDGKGQRMDVRAPIRNLPYFKYAKFNAWDRNQMAANQILTAERIAPKTRTALMTIGGFTMEDSAVVSKEFAEANQVRGVDGEMRRLKVGDKISDFGGNKATIGLIVDRNMDPAVAKKEQLTNEVEIFKQNPDLDVVMSPYSVITRDNAGIVHELMNSDTHDVSWRNPKTGATEVLGASGDLNIIVTDMLVDKKTHAYTAEDVKDGKGRKISSQLVWAFNELNADKTVQSFFGKNDAPWASFREYLVTTGYDMSADGKLQVGYHPHDGELRKVFNPDPDKSSTDFIRELGTQGGLLKLPVSVKLASGQETDELPILSASLRRNTELMDGEMQISDYTAAYAKIYSYATSYETAKSSDNKDKVASDQERAVRGLRHAVTSLESRIVNDKLGGFDGGLSKHSFIRERLMSKRVDRSATMVSTADPRLPLDVVGIGKETAATMKIRDTNNYILTHRDPALKAGAVWAVKPIIRDNSQLNADGVNDYVGIQENPAGVVIKGEDADFDGDTKGVECNDQPDVQDELAKKVAVKNRLLNPGAPTAETGLNVSVDLVSGALKAGIVVPTDSHPDKLTPKAQLKQLATNIAVNHAHEPEVALAKTNKLVHESLREGDYGAAYIALESKQAMMGSVKAIIDSGAKGSDKNLKEYEDYFDGRKTLKDAQEIQRASGIKADDTGVAGSYSQKSMALLRNKSPETALEITYPATQGTLQVKHDAEQGKVIDHALNVELNNLFNGRPVDGKKNDVLTKKAFTKQMTDVYETRLGVDLNPKYVDNMADLLSDGGQVIKPIKDLMPKYASPMDQIAYGGGLAVIDRLAKANADLTLGDKSALLVPESVRHAGVEKDHLIKRDTQDTQQITSIRQTIEEAMDKTLPADKQPAKPTPFMRAQEGVSASESTSGPSLEV